MKEPKSLTDFEVEGLQHSLNLADAHAYQELTAHFEGLAEDLDSLWEQCLSLRIPDMEYRFRLAFAILAGSSAMKNLSFFKISPTASNSIDIVAAVLSHLKVHTRLIEPTFDNLSLILRRRGVNLDSLSEDRLFSAAAEADIPSLLDEHPCGALFLVQPNNPTGRYLDATELQTVAEYCADRGIILVLDNSFRFYKRHSFDDYLLLCNSGASFLAFEDTGKVWPTHDLKASLLFCSGDLEDAVNSIYGELYLCSSRFTLALLEKYVLKTAEVGLSQTIWAQTDHRRGLLRRAIAETGLTVETTALNSQISVEWLNCTETGLRDLELTEILAVKGLPVLPGRHFFWHSSGAEGRHFNVRLALMKPLSTFGDAMQNLRFITLRNSVLKLREGQ